MLTHPTLDQLKTLKLDGMAEAFAEMDGQDGTADLTHAEWLGLLIDREAANLINWRPPNRREEDRKSMLAVLQIFKPVRSYPR